MNNRHDNQRTLRQTLRLRYIMWFIAQGIKTIAVNIPARFGIVVLILSGIIGYNLLPIIIPSYSVFPIVNLYRFAFVVCFSILVIIIIWFIGAPHGYFSIMSCMLRTGLSNAVGETPLIISRCALPNGRAEKWAFESLGVPFSSWDEYAERIESSCDVAIVRIENGDDERKVILTVVPHPGPWPDVIPWTDDKIDPSPSVLVLGENRSEKITIDLAKTAHMLIAGRTGSGKSVLQKSLMLQCLEKDMQVYLIDYKHGVDYSGKWSELCTIVYDDSALQSLLNNIYDTMFERLTTLKSSGVSNIDEYNDFGFGPMKRICIFFDELVECLGQHRAIDLQR